MNESNVLLKSKKISGVGVKTLEKLEKLNIFTVHDLLFHLPYKYFNKTKLYNIQDIILGDYVLLEIKVLQVKINPKNRSLVLYGSDNTGIIEIRFKYFNNSQYEHFSSLPTLRIFGEIRYGSKYLALYHPEYTEVSDTQEIETENTLTPIYRLTDKLSQKKLQDIIKAVLNFETKEYFSDDFLRKYNLLDINLSLKTVHAPSPNDDVFQLENKIHPAIKRLIFEELLANKFAMLNLKDKNQKYLAYSITNQDLDLINRFKKLLSFELTNAQNKVIKDIVGDLNLNKPMQRLIQGDVGSGKTVVAAIAMLFIIQNNMQAAFMAPTEILAEQHYKSISELFFKLDISVELLISKITVKNKKKIKEKIKSGDIQVIIGTHAVIQKDVEFKNLNLIIIDEQHKFGVEQRLALWKKSLNNNYIAHQLIMTATPIPRTLAQTSYSDLDISVIDELPKGRKAIQTIVVPDLKKELIVSRIKNICEKNQQIYWVCPLIEESEVLECQAAEQSYIELKDALPDLNIGLVHGRIDKNKKTEVMQDFINNKINILVATTVIEVGVNVPNATLMVIENAERLGLAQLHQLRGRVGRGSDASFCVLMYKTPLSQNGKARLEILRATNDGFKIAEKDLELRGFGQIYGVKQTGAWQLKIADLIRDKDILEQVNNAMNDIKDINIINKLIDRWVLFSDEYSKI